MVVYIIFYNSRLTSPLSKLSRIHYIMAHLDVIFELVALSSCENIIVAYIRYFAWDVDRRKFWYAVDSKTEKLSTILERSRLSMPFFKPKSFMHIWRLINFDIFTGDCTSGSPWHCGAHDAKILLLIQDIINFFRFKNKSLLIICI